MPKHVSKTSQTGKKKGKVLSAAMRQKAKEEEEAKDRLRAEKKAARAAKREAKATEKTAKKGSMKEVKEKEAKERMGKTEDQEDSASGESRNYPVLAPVLTSCLGLFQLTPRSNPTFRNPNSPT